MNKTNLNGQNGVATSAVNVHCIDNRNNGGNFKWQIEKVNVIKEYFNDDFFNDDLGQYIEVEIVVNSREVFPKVYFNGEYYFPERAAFQSSKKSVSDMVASMSEMIQNIAVEYGYIESDFYPTSWVNLTPSVFGTMVGKVFGTMREQVVEQENEQEQENEDIDYLVSIFNEKMEEDISKDFESTLQTIAEYGDTSGENEYVCGGFNYERDYEHEWVEFYNENGNGGINHAYEIFRNASDFTYVDFFNEDSACDLVYELGDTYGVGVDDNSWGECLLWVKNPYYNTPKNNAPILDNDIDRVVNTIKSYLANYIPSYLDQFGDCVITIGWDEFSENDMQMLIEDDIFEGLVIDSLVGENISDMLVYDDGVYVTVDYDKMFNKVA